MKRRMSLILAVLSIILAFVGSMTGVSYAYANEYEMHGSAIGNQLNEADITSIRFSYNRMEGLVSPYPVSGRNICTGIFVGYLIEG